MRKHFIFIFSFMLFYFPNSFALAEIGLVPQKPSLVEAGGAFVTWNPASPSSEPAVVMPTMRLMAPYGGQEVKCGPSPFTNTMSCFSFFKNAFYTRNYPIPGKIATQPVYYDHSWLIGTTKGFLLRVEDQGLHSQWPHLVGNNVNLWGLLSRQMMSHMRHQPIYAEGFQAPSVPVDSVEPKVPDGVKWVFSSESGFLSTPIVSQNRVFALSTSPYLQAFSWDTGKLLWSVRLAPDNNLHFENDSIVTLGDEAIVGNSLGMVQAFSVVDGSLRWHFQVPSADSVQRTEFHLPAGPDRFPGVVARPLVDGEKMIVSNSESMTVGLSLKNHQILWQYPEGSVAEIKKFEENILVGSTSGKIALVDHATGRELWMKQITDKSPIASIYVTKENFILVSNSLGNIFLLNEKGLLLDSTKMLGEVNGEFFQGNSNSDACITFAHQGFRCFRVISP